MNPLDLLFVLCVIAFTATAAAWDIRTKKLPNMLTVPACLAGIVFHAARGAVDGGWSGLGQGLIFSLGGFATGFGILLVLWLIGGGGGGDVKFMAALGAWLGAWPTLLVLIVSAVLVLFGSLGILAYQAIASGVGRTKRRFVDIPQKATAASGAAGGTVQARAARRLMPFGVPVALATWGVLAFQELVTR